MRLWVCWCVFVGVCKCLWVRVNVCLCECVSDVSMCALGVLVGCGMVCGVYECVIVCGCSGVLDVMWSACEVSVNVC